MAVAPINFGTPQISQGIDFAGMGQQLLQSFQQRQKRAILDQVAQGNGDPQDLIRAGLATGDISFANLGQSILNRQQDAQRQASQDARQLERDKVEDAFRRQQLGQTAAYQNAQLEISRRAADRADDKTPAGYERLPDNTYRPLPGGPQDPETIRKATEARNGPLDTPAGRAAVAQQYGIEPGTPEFKAWVLTSKLPGDNRPKLPSGFEYAPDGSLRPIKGGPADPDYLRAKPDKQNAPSGYVWNDPLDPSKGMKAIPGGPGEKIDAEVAGRLGLAKNFLSQLPSIKERVARGDATGLFDAAKAYGGVGEPGQIRRQIDSGAEALLRMLTGAGMNKEEAAEYTRRYKLSPTDTAATVLDKLNQLEGELNSVGETVGRGRGGWESVRGAPAAAAPKPGGVVDYRSYFGN